MSEKPVVNIRPAERKDCESIVNLIKELASYEKMEVQVKITGKEFDVINIRAAVRADCAAIVKLIAELNAYENIEDEINLTAADLERDAFDSNPPYCRCIVVEAKHSNHNDQQEEMKVIGYALYFHTYSTWEGKAIHLEDFYITEKFRHGGIGSKVLKYLANIAVEGGFARITLECLDWNKSAIQFYEKHNAINLTQKDGWQVFRLTSDVLPVLAGKSSK